ncbi:MAG: serine/threonine-protein phosphatase [Victivallales bacterium]|nr:serine/threonine-protein phosphatase [Victivallales bacterium]
MESSPDYGYVEFASISDAGLVRDHNEDSFLTLPLCGVFAVADGMGGGAAGEVASSIVVESLREACNKVAADSPGERKYTVQQTLHKANAEVLRYMREHGFSAMGSTVVALVLDSWDAGQAYVCHVGDSRLYCLRSGELFCLTVDHSMGEEMRKKNPAQRANLPEKLARVLTRVIGSEGLLVPEWQQVAICPGDVLLLCSDGVYGEMSEEELTKALGSASLQGALDFIRERVLAHGASDNFTALCLKVGATLPRAAVVEEWEREESDLLLRVAEERRDYGAK